LVMINRRNETPAIPQTKAPDILQQNHIKNALGNSVLCVDYVLDGGQIALSMLRNLDVGSVLPLVSLSDRPLEARANGKVVFSGVLNLTPNQMRFGVTHILAEAPND
jgi:flagellar motor switch protein FliM